LVLESCFQLKGAVTEKLCGQQGPLFNNNSVAMCKEQLTQKSLAIQAAFC